MVLGSGGESRAVIFSSVKNQGGFWRMGLCGVCHRSRGNCLKVESGFRNAEEARAAVCIRDQECGLFLQTQEKSGE